MTDSHYIDLEKLTHEMLTCTQCGFCKNVCPVFLDDGWDASTPRGRMILAYGLVSGELQPDPSLTNSLFQCTQCRDCLRRCPSNADCPEVILAGRREMVRLGNYNENQAAMVQNIAETGNIFGDKDVDFPDETGDVPMFIGCQYLARPNSTKKSIKILKKLGVQPGIIPEVCCGFPLAVMGFESQHREQINKLKTMLPEGKDVVTLCPSCMVHLHDEYAMNSTHILQIVREKIIDIPVKPIGKKVTYHDPCDLSRGAGIIDEPREILAAIGCELVEMEHTKKLSRCCGGGGGILSWDGDLSGRMSRARIREALATGAEMLVTACPTCEQTLKNGARLVATETGTKPLPVRNIMDLVAKALK